MNAANEIKALGQAIEKQQAKIDSIAKDRPCPDFNTTDKSEQKLQQLLDELGNKVGDFIQKYNKPPPQ